MIFHLPEIFSSGLVHDGRQIKIAKVAKIVNCSTFFISFLRGYIPLRSSVFVRIIIVIVCFFSSTMSFDIRSHSFRNAIKKRESFCTTFNCGLLDDHHIEINTKSPRHSVNFIALILLYD